MRLLFLAMVCVQTSVWGAKDNRMMKHEGETNNPFTWLILKQMERLENKQTEIQNVIIERQRKRLQHLTTEHVKLKLNSQHQMKLFQSKLDNILLATEKNRKTLSSKIEEIEKKCPTRYEDVKRKIASVEAELSKLTKHTVAFSARLSASKTKVQSFTPILFDTVAVNVGNAYNKRTGKFTAPVSGIYLFFYNLLVNSASDMDSCLWSSKEHRIAYGYAGKASGHLNNGGNLVIRHIDAGTQIWVTKCDSYGNFLHERFTSFSGFLLQRDN